MRDFNRGRRDGGRSERDRFDKPDMHDAICDNCGKACRVPFKPSGDKPIYCSKCFEKVEEGSLRRDSRDSRGGSSRDRDSQSSGMFSAICDDCGRSCQVPFRPSSDKPIYCSRCFENRGNGRDVEVSGNAAQNNLLDEINTKLDKIILILETKKTRVKKTIEPVTEEVVEEA